jgi:carboxyvinyl-carboxyphosphonate phosphorylmutase
MPDLILVTMTEVVQLAQRIVGSTSLSLFVDADHGFGNALNVMRCVREFEAAGVAALTLEDTELPRPYGARGPSAIPIKEMCGKLKAALTAREDPDLVIIGRTDTIRYRPLAEALERARAYQETGVDAVFLPGVRSREALEAVREAISLPLISSGLPQPEAGKSGLQILQEIGYRMTLLSAFPFRVAIQAMHDTVTYLKEHGDPGPYADKACASQLLEKITRKAQYAEYQEQFLRDGDS